MFWQLSHQESPEDMLCAEHGTAKSFSLIFNMVFLFMLSFSVHFFLLLCSIFLTL